MNYKVFLLVILTSVNFNFINCSEQKSNVDKNAKQTFYIRHKFDLKNYDPEIDFCILENPISSPNSSCCSGVVNDDDLLIELYTWGHIDSKSGIYAYEKKGFFFKYPLKLFRNIDGSFKKNRTAFIFYLDGKEVELIIDDKKFYQWVEAYYNDYLTRFCCCSKNCLSILSKNCISNISKCKDSCTIL